jgi:hypothetical protein
MKWLQDSYQCVAADAAAGFCGRGFNPRLGQWENLRLLNLSQSAQTSMRLRTITVFVLTSTLALKEGVQGGLYTVLDYQRTDFLARLLGGSDLQGGSSLITWMGDFPMSCGVLSRFNLGSIDTGDIINTLVGYDAQ